jgi:hypothetical protein
MTANIYNYFGDLDYSDIVLYSISAKCHYSDISPGDFYVDDLKIFANAPLRKPPGLLWDITGDGYVGIDDIVQVAEHFGTEE